MRLWLALLVVGCGGGASATSPDAGGDGPGDTGSTGDDRLDPLEVGRTWSYDVTSTYPSCPGGRHDTHVVSAGTTDGRATFEVATLTGWAPHASQQQPLKPGSAKTRLADALGVAESSLPREE